MIVMLAPLFALFSFCVIELEPFAVEVSVWPCVTALPVHPPACVADCTAELPPLAESCLIVTV